MTSLFHNIDLNYLSNTVIFLGAKTLQKTTLKYTAWSIIRKNPENQRTEDNLSWITLMLTTYIRNMDVYTGMLCVMYNNFNKTIRYKLNNNNMHLFKVKCSQYTTDYCYYQRFNYSGGVVSSSISINIYIILVFCFFCWT